MLHQRKIATDMNADRTNQSTHVPRMLTVELVDELDIDQPLNLSHYGNLPTDVRIALVMRLTNSVVVIHREVTALASELERLEVEHQSLLRQLSAIGMNLNALHEAARS